jgi:SAM-dependent methyltransferase
MAKTGVAGRVRSGLRKLVARHYRYRGVPALSGWCLVCGCATHFFAPPEVSPRESLACACCLATSRYRSIARGILRAVSELCGIEAESLEALARAHPHAQMARRIEVYDTQPPFYYSTIAYPIPDILSRAAFIGVELSLHQPDRPWGERLGPRLTNQSLERLSFPDHRFDLVITSDVMEHVRLDQAAHREIHRVLKPGGIYLFTVPHVRAWPHTQIRVEVTDPVDPERDRFLLEKEYHGDANSRENAALCYRIYGRDLDEHLAQLGFEVDYTAEDFPQWGILETELFYCRRS